MSRAGRHRPRSPAWRASALASLIAGAFLIAGLVLGARHDDGAVAATTPTMTQPPSTATPTGAPIDPAPGAAGRPLVAPAVYTSHHGVLDVTLVASEKRVSIAGRPGKRWEVLVRGGRRGATPLKTLFYHEGDDNYPVTTLATLVTTGGAVRPAPTPSVISWASVDLRLAHVARRRTVVFSENKAGTVFYINGQSYDPSKINFRAKLNTVEEWTIVNHTEETHPFHMHTYPMQLISVNGVPSPFNGYQDEIVLPPHGYVVARIRFAQFTGETVFHCHILAHEDAGMMANILVTRR